jgi:CBS domain-containing protein
MPWAAATADAGARRTRAALRRLPRRARGSAPPDHAARNADLVALLLAAGTDPAAIARVVARRNEVLTRRILRRAEAELGGAPAPYAWIVFGSGGRMEQTLHTDQDDLLAYADEGEPRRGWFQALAERVNGELETAGFAPCRGGHMARNDLASLSEWRRRFDAAVDGAHPHEAELWLDCRRVGGRLDVAPLESSLARAARAPLLLHLLAREALAFRPPAPLLLRLRPSTVVDVKLHGLVPIVFLARCYAVEAGSAARSTPERLDAARRAGSLAAVNHAGVGEAYRFLLSLRLRLQLRARATGGTFRDRFPACDLAASDRARLREAFAAIRRWQGSAAYHFLVAR